MRTTETQTSHKLSLRLSISTLLAVAASLLLSSSGAYAQSDAAAEIGTIPGTQMQRDEFRGRALAQLNAVALNAHAYQIVNGEYPQDFARLRGSDAWNIDVKNMFSGQRLRSIYFEPGPADMTTSPPSWGQPATDMPSGPVAPPPAAGGGGQGAAGSIEEGLQNMIQLSGVIAREARINPRAIRSYEPGDVFYYVSGELLQLIIFAPDGTFVEWVDEIPNPNFREGMSLSAETASLPFDLYSLQTLYYLDDLLTQNVALVRFMSNQDNIPAAAMDQLDAFERLSLCAEIGVTVLNPFTHQPAVAGTDAIPGEFVLGAAATPVMACLHDGRVVAASGIRSGLDERAAAAQKQAPAGKAKPPGGGKRGKAKPGGGRKPR